MKKFNYIVIGLLALVIFSCSKQGDQGAAGPKGDPGSQGASLGYYYIPGYIPVGSFLGTTKAYYVYRRLPTLDISTSNLLDVIFTKDNTSNPKAVYYSMPATDVFQLKDELYYTFGHDTLTIHYTGTAMPAYQINWIADIVPQP